MASLERRLLAGEFLGHVLLVVLLLGAGVHWPVAIAVAISLALAGRAGYVAFSRTLARTLDDRPAPRTGLAAGLRAGVGEWLALTFTHSVLQPFCAGLLLRCRWPSPGDRDEPAVVLVHGYCATATYWLPMFLRLRRRGLAVVPPPTLEPAFGGIDEQADALGAHLRDVRARYPGRPVVLVGHSMGGLTARACLAAGGGDAVIGMVTLGTPHGGTRLARFGPGKNARQMRPGSAWLAELERVAPPGALPLTAVAASHDELVSPWRSALPAGACAHRIVPSGHLALGWQRASADAVSEAVSAARRRPESPSPR